MRETIPIIHRFNDDYALPAAVSMHSMLRRADPRRDYTLYVLHSDVTLEHQKRLQDVVGKFPNASLTFSTPEQDALVARLFERTKNKAHFAAEMFWTLLLPEVFPEINQCVMTDVDVVWLGDVSEVWDASRQFLSRDWMIAGVPGLAPVTPTWLTNYYGRYHEHFTDEEVERISSGVGAGLLVLQLDRLREAGMSRRFLDYAFENAHRVRQPEQDVINLVAHDNIVHLPLRSMVCTYFYEMQAKGELAAGDSRWAPREVDEALAGPIQLHFAGNGRRKPWINPAALFGASWFEELAQTDFLLEWLETHVRDRRDARQRRLWSFPVPLRKHRRISVMWERNEP